MKLKLTDVWNRVTDVEGVRVASVQWKRMPYMIVETTDTFDDCKSRDFTPIMEFRTLAELNKALV